MQVHFSAAWINQYFVSVVIQIEGNVHRLFSNLHPISTSALLPDHTAIVVALRLLERRSCQVGADRRSADLNQSHRGAADFGGGSVQNEPPVLQQTKALIEAIKPCG